MKGGYEVIITVDIQKKLHQMLERDKRKTGLSKSYLVRQIIMKHYGVTHEQAKGAA